MRTRIRLTGRKPLPHSSIAVGVTRDHAETRIALSIAKPRWFKSFPPNAKVKLRLSENKITETLNFGKLATLPLECKIQNQTAFSAPTCQLRVVQSNGERKGVLLGSSTTWTLLIWEEEVNPSEQRKGILPIGLRDIAPRTWKLEIREDAHPVLYLDANIPNARTWARTDPVFVSSVFPAVVREIFDDIFIAGNLPDIEWMADWLKWAGSLMPGQPAPFDENSQRKQEWVDQLLHEFCQRSRSLDLLCEHLGREATHA